MICRNASKMQAVRPVRLSVKPRAVRDRSASKAALSKRPRRRRGLSIIELLVALAITAALLTATMVAIDASFRAYAVAVETASTQTVTRMVTHRLLTLVRTSTAHGPLQPDDDPQWPVVASGGDRDMMESQYLELLDPKGQYLRIEYRAGSQELWLLIDDNGNFAFDAGETEQPLIGGVTAAKFHTRRRTNSTGVLVLERGSVDLTVAADEDNTLAIEAGDSDPIRVIASTMPRKLD